MYYPEVNQFRKGFYSTLVRLKVLMNLIGAHFFRKFLFHIGAIKSRSHYLTALRDLNVSIPHWCD